MLLTKLYIYIISTIVEMEQYPFKIKEKCYQIMSLNRCVEHTVVFVTKGLYYMVGARAVITTPTVKQIIFGVCVPNLY